jgi:hypothetical protein
MFNVQRIIIRYFIKTILCQLLCMMNQNCIFFYAQLIALCGTLDFEPVAVTRSDQFFSFVF